ncbi:MAG: PhoP regulatory network YrbL family protein [Rickettsiales bacterium]|jgi:hypothetical protein|nr:PhoP regulatory network YrbL family protein [Rickettsiales bacterium]
MIFLTEKDIYARGGRRIIYNHPDNPDALIKITDQDIFKQVLKQKRKKRIVFREKYYDENYRDFMAYRQYDKMSPAVYDFIPRIYGFEKTNFGEGLLVEKIKNFDGTPCPTLEEYLANFGATKEILEALRLLYEKMRAVRFVSRELRGFNLLIRRAPTLSASAYVIDGFGNQNFFAWLDKIPPLAEKKIRRRFERFLLSIGLAMRHCARDDFIFK